MNPPRLAGVPALDDPQAARRAGRDLLSLALIDTRNHLLHALAQFEAPATLRWAAQAAWYQEHWIVRHVQCQRGEACDATAPRLGGRDAQQEAWQQGQGRAPSGADLRGWLAQSLDATCELLHTAADSDAGLHFYRLALAHEDRCGEAMNEEAALHPHPHPHSHPHQIQHPQMRPRERADAPGPAARVQTVPLWLPAQRWRLGSEPAGGVVPAGERWAHDVQVPEFEIDAQAVCWAQWAEFVVDGGYDRPELWSLPGWAWVQTQGRRAPRGVEQMAGGALVQRGGVLQRAAAGQAAGGISRLEAEAWCTWAGRRLPTEPEWELAASSAESRGFLWGDVLEWVAGSPRAWPGHRPVPGDIDPLPHALPGVASHGVLRGAGPHTRRRARHAKSRRFVPLTHDAAGCGFRSCAI